VASASFAGPYESPGAAEITGNAAPPDRSKGMEIHRGKARMEERYGEIRDGVRTIGVRGTEVRLRDVLARWMMDVPEVWTLDGGELGNDRFWVRVYDADDRYVTVFEFDGEFRILSEMSADGLEWEGESFFASRTR
jgi:transposase InsO family protein